jgi:Mg2+ and Co2+ transporter CorA
MHLALQTARDEIKNDSFLIEMRDLGYELDRNFELLLEDVRNAIQYRTAREAEEQARLSKEALRASHRLNILAALFFPLTAIASVFGMQLAHGLDEHNPTIFWVIFAVAVALGFGMKAWVLGDSAGKKQRRKD